MSTMPWLTHDDNNYKRLFKIKRIKWNQTKEEKEKKGKEVKKIPKREQTLSVQVRRMQRRSRRICWLHNLLYRAQEVTLWLAVISLNTEVSKNR